MTEVEHAAMGRRFFETWNQRDFDTLSSLFAEDAEVADLAAGVTTRGPDGARQESERWANAFPDGKLEIRNTIAGSSGVVVEGILRGTNTGPLQGPGGELPPTNRSVEMPFALAWELQGGKVTRQRGYYDSATLMSQLGLMPEVPAGAPT